MTFLMARILALAVLLLSLVGCGRAHVGQSVEAQEAETRTPKEQTTPPEGNAERRKRAPTEPAPIVTVDLEKPPKAKDPEK